MVLIALGDTIKPFATKLAILMKRMIQIKFQQSEIKPDCSEFGISRQKRQFSYMPLIQRIIKEKHVECSLITTRLAQRLKLEPTAI